MSEESNRDKSLVQQQFGAHAQEYATSVVHAKGASLARLVELVQPQPDWVVLDVATAAGHTAFAFAPHVAQVIATDITPEMLPVAANVAAEKGITNVALETADAEDLPYDNGIFDLVTCRIAPHHFHHVVRFVAECYRVLKPGGTVAVVDNVVPGSRTDDAAGAAQRTAGAAINDFEKQRDPSHGRCLSVAEWLALFDQVGFQMLQQETAPKRMLFDPWVKRMGASPATQANLRNVLLNATGEVAAFFRPQTDGGDLAFHLLEAIFIGRK